jgi:hypothetical protein
MPAIAMEEEYNHTATVYQDKDPYSDDDIAGAATGLDEILLIESSLSRGKGTDVIGRDEGIGA